MTLAVGHREDTVVVVDAIREVKPPFSPEDVVDEFVTTLRKYRIIKITGDRYAGEWPCRTDTAAAFHVLHDNGLPDALSQPCCNPAPDRVGEAANGKSDDDGDALVWIVRALRPAGGRSRDHGAKAGDQDHARFDRFERFCSSCLRRHDLSLRRRLSVLPISLCR